LAALCQTSKPVTSTEALPWQAASATAHLPDHDDRTHPSVASSDAIRQLAVQNHSQFNYEIQ